MKLNELSIYRNNDFISTINIKYKNSIKREKKRLNIQTNVDQLLDKIREVGYEGLTDDEKDQLLTYSRHLGKNIEKD